MSLECLLQSFAVSGLPVEANSEGSADELSIGGTGPQCQPRQETSVRNAESEERIGHLSIRLPVSGAVSAHVTCAI